MRRTWVSMRPKTLQQMFRKLKLAGAHPDILWGIDAAKAQHNGEEMIRLESLMHERSTRASGNQSRLNAAPQNFVFWLKPSESSTTLRASRCTITPLSSEQIVKDQLTSLFRDVGIMEDFVLSERDPTEQNIKSVLHFADSQQTEHIHQLGPLYVRGDKSVEIMRRFGVLLVVEEGGLGYLVTLPELGPQAASGQEFVSTHQAPPMKTLIGPNGEIDPDVQTFMTDRGLRPFDLRMAGGQSSIERFVQAFERLERMYEVHRGRALRSGVCLVLSVHALSHTVSPDGCIILSLQQMPTWEEYLLSLPQETWRDAVQKHMDWRIGVAPKLQDRRRRLRLVADIFQFHRVTLESPLGGRLDWQESLLLRLAKEEKLIRQTMNKYNIKSDVLRKRGEIRFVEHMYSATLANSPAMGGDRKEIGFRLCGDGTLLINQSIMTTGQILRVLKDNIKRMDDFKVKHDRVITNLERLSRNIPVDFSVDAEWKYREEGNFVNCLIRFADTMKSNEGSLQQFFDQLAGSNASYVAQAHSAGPKTLKKRLVWIISDRFDVMPSGVMFIPHNVDLKSIQQILLQSNAK